MPRGDGTGPRAAEGRRPQRRRRAGRQLRVPVVREESTPSAGYALRERQVPGMWPANDQGTIRSDNDWLIVPAHAGIHETDSGDMLCAYA